MTQPSCANSGTTLIWGKLRIQNGILRRFEETTRYDNSGTDALGAKFVVEVEGYVAFQEGDQSLFVGRTAVDTQAQAPIQLRAYKEMVWLPRQAMRLVIGGVTVLEAYGSPPRVANQGQAPGTDYVDLSPSGRPLVDIDNGPRCVGFVVQEVYGNRAMRVTLSLECTLALCPGSYTLINNRWSITEDFDSDWRLRRTVVGVARVAHVDGWDNAIKQMVLPPLLDGFRVESMNFGRSTNGLELTYQIVMQQMFSAPPWPASGWKCSVQEETNLGGKGTLTFNCSLTGFVGVTKRDLFVVAIQTFLTRLGRWSAGNALFHTTLTHKVAVVDHLDSNQLDVFIVADRLWNTLDSSPGEDGGKTALAATTRWLGVVWDRLGLLPPIDLNSDPTLSNPRQDDGTAPTTDKWLYPNPLLFPDSIPSLFYMRFGQNPCTQINLPNGTVINYQQEGEVGSQDGEPNVGQTSYPGSAQEPQNDNDQNKVANAQSANHFTDVELQSRYMTAHGRVQMPFSSRSDAQQPTCVIRRVHQPISKRVIYYRATRHNAKPSIPKIKDSFTDTNDIHYHLDISEILPSPPMLAPDGTTYLFTIELRLEYLMDRTIEDGEAYQPGSLPWDTSSLAENALRITDIESEEIA